MSDADDPRSTTPTPGPDDHDAGPGRDDDRPLSEGRTGRGDRGVPAWFVLVPALTFLVGALLGGVVMGVGGGGGGDDEGSPAEATPTSPSTTGPGTAVVVPDSCIEAADTVRDATDVIREGIDAARGFDPDVLLDRLNELEDLDNQAREQAATCSGTTVTDAPLGEESSTGSPEPSQAPTTAESPSEG